MRKNVFTKREIHRQVMRAVPCKTCGNKGAGLCLTANVKGDRSRCYFSCARCGRFGVTGVHELPGGAVGLWNAANRR